MDANQNPPSEREWTVEEREAFFSSDNAITGLPNSALAGMPTNALPFRPTASINHCGDELAKEWPWCIETGIHVTSVTPPESGWLMSFYCSLCKETWFLLSPWALKPKEGDYWRIQMCGSDVEGFRHNLQLGMKGYDEPIELQPSSLWWAKEEITGEDKK